MKTLSDNDKKDVKADAYYDVRSLLRDKKKIVTFMGASQSGTSFMVNNAAQYLSEKNIDIAILDATENRNSYYIYTKNEEILRETATTSIKNLANGEAKGIKVNDNLTVYTGVPGEEEAIQKVEPILETLLKKHDLILIDCDFKTPEGYFEYASEIYLIQTMEVLTIQPLTEVLAKLINKGIVRESQLRIIINKYVKVDGITEEKIIGGMAYYNDPSMAYMKELFNKKFVRYITIPFDKQIYEKYLAAVANCVISIEGYPQDFLELLDQLCTEIYPVALRQ